MNPRSILRATFKVLPAAALLAACHHDTCPRTGTGPDNLGIIPASGRLSGRGFVHYHPYPDTGQAFCGVGLDFAARKMMVAAVSPSIHATLADDSLCTRTRYARVRSETSGREVTVAILDKGGQPISDWQAREQHVMDLSERAFALLDEGGAGLHAGRIYVTWEILPAGTVPVAP